MQKYKCTKMNKLPRTLVAPPGSPGTTPTHYAVTNSTKLSYLYQNGVFAERTDTMVVYKNRVSLHGIGRSIYRYTELERSTTGRVDTL
jgi:hypothetical protein